MTGGLVLSRELEISTALGASTWWAGPKTPNLQWNVQDKKLKISRVCDCVCTRPARPFLKFEFFSRLHAVHGHPKPTTVIGRARPALLVGHSLASPPPILVRCAAGCETQRLPGAHSTGIELRAEKNESKINANSTTRCKKLLKSAGAFIARRFTKTNGFFGSTTSIVQIAKACPATVFPTNYATSALKQKMKVLTISTPADR